MKVAAAQEVELGASLANCCFLLAAIVLRLVHLDSLDYIRIIHISNILVALLHFMSARPT